MTFTGYAKSTSFVEGTGSAHSPYPVLGRSRTIALSTGKIRSIDHHDHDSPLPLHRQDGEWEHARIILKPHNPDYPPITLEPEDEGEARVVGEFMGIV
jgi:hypothetical protein